MAEIVSNSQCRGLVQPKIVVVVFNVIMAILIVLFGHLICFLTLNSERFVGITLCPARGSHVGSGLYQQLM